MALCSFLDQQWYAASLVFFFILFYLFFFYSVLWHFSVVCNICCGGMSILWQVFPFSSRMRPFNNIKILLAVHRVCMCVCDLLPTGFFIYFFYYPILCETYSRFSHAKLTSATLEYLAKKKTTNSFCFNFFGKHFPTNPL